MYHENIHKNFNPSFDSSVIVSLFFLENLFSQAVNTGELYITEDTQFSTIEDFNNTPAVSLIIDGDVYMYADWNNDDLVDFLVYTGTTSFVGSNLQRMSGNNSSYFYDVLFDNSSVEVPF